MKAKPKVRVSPRERQMVLEFLRALYVEEIPVADKKPPSPEGKPNLVAFNRKATA